MNEYGSESHEYHLPRTEAELASGIKLEPQEIVLAEMPNDLSVATREYDIGNGVGVRGRAVAELVVGGEQTNARGLIIETGAHGPSGHLVREFMVLIPGVGEVGQPFAAKLTSGQSWGVGRSFEGMQNFPDTVSGDHLAIGQEEDGKLRVENHNPTNHTWLRTIGRYA